MLLHVAGDGDTLFPELVEQSPEIGDPEIDHIGPSTRAEIAGVFFKYSDCRSSRSLTGALELDKTMLKLKPQMLTVPFHELLWVAGLKKDIANTGYFLHKSILIGEQVTMMLRFISY